MSGQSEKGKKAHAVLVEYHTFIFRQAHRSIPFPDLAEDVAQQVCADFLAKADRWDLEKDARPLLKKMVQHRALSAWRERVKLLPETLQKIGMFIQQVHNENDTEADERLAALKSCMQKLPEEGRRLITKHHFDGVPTKQIAEELQKTNDAVRKAIYRIQEGLRFCIEQTLKTEKHRD